MARFIPAFYCRSVFIRAYPCPMKSFSAEGCILNSCPCVSAAQECCVSLVFYPAPAGTQSTQPELQKGFEDSRVQGVGSWLIQPTNQFNQLKQKTDLLSLRSLRLCGIQNSNLGVRYSTFMGLNCRVCLRLQVILKRGFGPEVTADAKLKPQTYIQYFEDLSFASNKEIGFKDFFESACKQR